MALYTKAQFAEKCRIAKKGSAYIATYIKRGKIIASGDYIDDTIQENAEFLRKQLEKNTANQAEISNKEEVPKVANPVRHVPAAPVIEDPDYIPNISAEIDKKIKQQDLQKKQVEIRLLEIREQKLRGEVIPTNLVKEAFSRYSKLMVTEFDNTLDRVFSMAAMKFKISNEQMVTFKAEIKQELNKTTDIAADTMNSDITKIVNEHKESRSRGEKK